MMTKACRLGLLLFLFLLLSGPRPGWSAMVLVGGYDFAPFVEIGPDGRPQGLTLDVINALNAGQSEHEFIFVYTSPSRRYQDYQNGHFDAMFFEDPSWGWKERGINLEASDPILEGGEVYIALAEPGRGQDYFYGFDGKRLAGVLGFHYGLAGFNADPDYLRNEFKMTLVESNKAIVRMILKNRADIAVITKAYLDDYLANHPKEKDKFIIADRWDQQSSYSILVRPGFLPSAQTISRMLQDLDNKGAIKSLSTLRGFSNHHAQ